MSEAADEKLLQALRGPDGAARRAAAEALVDEMVVSDARIEAAATLASSDDPRCRQALVRYLRELPFTRTLRVRLLLTERLADDDARVRSLAIAALTHEHADAANVPLLIERLEDEDPQVARMALIGLTELAPGAAAFDEGACGALHAYARREPDQAGRVGRLLSRARDPRAGDLLLDAIAHGSHFWHNAGRRPIDRAATFEALRHHDTPRTREALRDAVLRDPYAYGKEAAYASLRALDDPQAIPERLYRRAPAASHPPSDAAPSFDRDQSRARLLEDWLPRVDDPSPRVREDARAILRWIKHPECLEHLRKALGRVPDEERALLGDVIVHLRSLQT